MSPELSLVRRVLGDEPQRYIIVPKEAERQKAGERSQTARLRADSYPEADSGQWHEVDHGVTNAIRPTAIRAIHQRTFDHHPSVELVAKFLAR